MSPDVVIVEAEGERVAELADRFRTLKGVLRGGPVLARPHLR